MARCNWIRRRADTPTRQSSASAGAATAGNGEEIVAIRPVGPRLSVRSLQRLVSTTVSAPPAMPRAVVFDFSEIEELVGGWSQHFAILMNLARQSRHQVSVRSLHGQPLRAAWLYRGNRELRNLFEPNAFARVK